MRQEEEGEIDGEIGTDRHDEKGSDKHSDSDSHFNVKVCAQGYGAD